MRLSNWSFTIHTYKALNNCHQQALHARFAFVAVCFSYWVCWIFWFVRFATLEALNHDIQPPQTTGIHFECLRSLLLHLRPPQAREFRWRHSWTCFYLFATPATIKKGSAHVPPSVWRVPCLQSVEAATAVVEVADVKLSSLTVISDRLHILGRARWWTRDQGVGDYRLPQYRSRHISLRDKLGISTIV